MFWRDRERESNESNGGPPCGQIRVLVVGDSGVGKSSLVHLIVNGSSISRPSQTVGCSVSIKHTTYGSSGSSSHNVKGDSERDFFVELWDISGHERYKDCRSLFYSQINGVIFVYDLSQPRTKKSLQKWAVEVSANGSFSAPLGSGGPGGLPVPYIVIGNKADVAAKEGPRGSSGNLVDAARQWVEKQGLLPSSDELPLTESFPDSGALLAAGKEARFDKEAVTKFLCMLIRRRYFSEELPSSNPWSISPSQRPVHHSGDSLSDDDHYHKAQNWGRLERETRTSQAVTHLGTAPTLSKGNGRFSTKQSLSGDPYKYNMLPPLSAQRNLTPPPTLYPQQPVSVTGNYHLPRFAMSAGSQEVSNTRSKRMDINV